LLWRSKHRRDDGFAKAHPTGYPLVITVGDIYRPNFPDFAARHCIAVDQRHLNIIACSTSPQQYASSQSLNFSLMDHSTMPRRVGTRSFKCLALSDNTRNCTARFFLLATHYRSNP
jgi:hypothetical protein